MSPLNILFSRLSNLSCSLPQLLWAGFVLQPLSQLCCISLDSPQHLHVPGAVKGQNWTQNWGCDLASAECRGDNHCSGSAATKVLHKQGCNCTPGLSAGSYRCQYKMIKKQTKKYFEKQLAKYIKSINYTGRLRKIL